MSEQMLPWIVSRHELAFVVHKRLLVFSSIMRITELINKEEGTCKKEINLCGGVQNTSFKTMML